MNKLLRYEIAKASMASEDELYHHGVLGMKWGVRRYQPYGSGGYTPKSERSSVDFDPYEAMNKIDRSLSKKEKNLLGVGNDNANVPVEKFFFDRGLSAYLIATDYKGKYKDEHPIPGKILGIAAMKESRGTGVTDKLISDAKRFYKNEMLVAEIDKEIKRAEEDCNKAIKVCQKENFSINLSKNKLTEKILDILTEKDFENQFNKLKILNLSGNLLHFTQAKNYQNFFEKFKSLKSFIVKHTPFELMINNYTRTIINRHYEKERKKIFETKFTNEDLEIQKIVENDNYLVKNTNVTISLLDTNNFKYVSKIKKYFPAFLERINFETRFYDNK